MSLGSFFSKAGNVLGLSGSGEAGSNASRQLFQIGQDLKNFTPIRIKTAVGTGTYGPSGVDLNLDPRLTVAANRGLDFFGNTMDQLNTFNQGDATQKTLDLLRALRSQQFLPQLSSLESRLLQQGRLGLATGGAAANPELSGFFNANAMADLQDQLAAMQEARAQRESLLGAANSGLNLALNASMPSDFMSGLFNMGALANARDMAAAQIESGGPALEYKGMNADLSQRANFFGNLISSGTKIAVAGQ